jgi:hypothetical protein
VIETPAPGLYAGVPDSDYHGDRGSLSSSGARRLLEVAPAQWVYERDHPREPTPEMILGSAVHTLTLDVGAPVTEVETDTWATKAAKEKRAEIEADGGIALKSKDYEQVHEMAGIASAVIDDLVPDEDTRYPELSGWAVDPDTGVMLRVRPDLLVQRPDGSWYAIDLKTSASAKPEKVDRSFSEFGYHLQEEFYRFVLALLGIQLEYFIFVVVAKEPPYLAATVDVDPYDLDTAARLNRSAIDLYAKCSASWDWPAYPHHTVRLSPWATHREAYL